MPIVIFQIWNQIGGGKVKSWKIIGIGSRKFVEKKLYMCLYIWFGILIEELGLESDRFNKFVDNWA